MRYAVADTASGRVLRAGQCAVDHLDIQAGTGQVAIDISDLDFTTWHEEDWHYDGTNVVVRAALPYTLPTTATAGTPVTLTAPAGTAVLIDGASADTVGTGGSEQITFTDVGTYDVALQLWPYLNAQQMVVVS